MSTLDQDKQIILNALTAVRSQRPLVLNITNNMVMNNTANALLAIGASPIMAHAVEELPEMLTLAGALLVNIGSLDRLWLQTMTLAVEQANVLQRPVVLDPAGCGATRFRTASTQQLATAADRLIIRSNAADIMALAGYSNQQKGVHTLTDGLGTIEAAQQLVARYQAQVIISGRVDYLVNAQHVLCLTHGHPLMARVTGMGCTLSALCAAFAAVGEDSGLAATATLGMAAEQAASIAQGPGSLQTQLLDALYNLNIETISKGLRCQRSVALEAV